MALDKLVDSTQLDADLTAVANAIRTKGGTSAALAFPAGFVTAIGAISGGGSVQTGTVAGNGSADITIPVNGTVSAIIVYTEDFSTGVNYENVEVTAVSGVGFWGAALASALTPTRALYKAESSYTTGTYVTFATGSVTLRPTSTGSGNQKWINGATYKWVAW